jgi:hypothetical protein
VAVAFAAYGAIALLGAVDAWHASSSSVDLTDWLQQ